MTITAQPVLTGNCSEELENFVCAKFYCLQSIAGVNYSVNVREKMLHFVSM